MLFSFNLNNLFVLQIPVILIFPSFVFVFSRARGFAGTAVPERGRPGAPEEEGAGHEPQGSPLQVLCTEHGPRHPRARAGLPLSQGELS